MWCDIPNYFSNQIPSTTNEIVFHEEAKHLASLVQIKIKRASVQ